MNTEVMFSSKAMDWATPQAFFDELDSEFHFTLDPCANESNHKCARYFTEADDGLKQPWGGQTVFCNPPYGRAIKDWVKKCSEEAKQPDTTVVLLIPARTDTAYFHDYIYQKPNVEIRFLRGRWVASITHNGKRIFIGRFHDKEDAVAARLNAEVHLFGEFSPQWEKEIAS